MERKIDLLKARRILENARNFVGIAYFNGKEEVCIHPDLDEAIKMAVALMRQEENAKEI